MHTGPSVSHCRRLREIAHPGQTLVSAGAAGAAGDRLPAGTTLDDLGVHRLRDLSLPGRVFALRDGGDARDMPPLRSLDTSPNNLPSRLTTFVGREAELAELHAYLAGTRLLTIAGPGGSGKTRLLAQLAAEQAGRWPDGVWWVELGALVDPAQVAAAVAATLGVLVDPARGAAASLAAQVAGRRLLLCLDNCEHVLDAAAGVAEALRDAPEVSIVATSREPLGLTGEVVWRLAPLAPADARELFLERGAQVAARSRARRRGGRRDRVDVRAPRRLAAGARARRRVAADAHPASIEAGLDDRFSLLVRSPRDAVPRHASLLALDGLEPRPARRRRPRRAPPARDLRRRLRPRGRAGRWRGVGRWSPIARLVDKSLVVAQDAGGELRYRLPETIRDYAMDRLRAAGERPAAADRHLDHRLAQVRDAAPDLENDKDRWRTALARDHENLRAAIEHGLEAEDPERGRRAGRRAAVAVAPASPGARGNADPAAGDRRAPDERSALQAHLLAGIALVADTADPLDVELDAASRAGELAAEHGDERLLSLCLALAAVGRSTPISTGRARRRWRRSGSPSVPASAFVVDAGRALRGSSCTCGTSMRRRRRS